MAEETVLVPPASTLTKLRGGDKRRSSSSSGKGVTHYDRGSAASCHESCKHGKNDAHVGEVREIRPWHKPVTENGGGTVHAKGTGVTAVIKKTVVVKPKALGDGNIESPTRETQKQEIVITSEHVDVHTEQSASEIMMTVTEKSKISEGPETNLPSEELVKGEILVASEIEKMAAEETSSDTKDLNLFKKSCALSKVKPSLLRLPSLISSGSIVGRTTDGQKSEEGRKSISGKKVLEGRKSFDGRKVVEGRKSVDGKVLEGRKSFDGRKRSDESKNVDPDITQECDGIASNVENNNEGSKSADEMKGTEGSKSSPSKIGSDKSKSLSLETIIKNGGLVNAKTNGKSDTLKKHVAAPKPKILSMRPSRSLNPVAVKPPSLLHPSSGLRTMTTENNQAGKKISTSKLDAKKASIPSTVSPSSSSPSVNGEENTGTKKVRVVRVLSSARRQSKTTKVAAEEFNHEGVQEDTVDVIKLAPAKKSPASTKFETTSSDSLLSPPSVSKSTERSRISYLPARIKKPLGEAEHKIAAKGASSSGLRKGKAADVESENKKPSKLEVKSTTTLVGETTHRRRSYLKKNDGPGGDVHKISSDKFLPGRPNVRRKKSIQVLSNKVLEETANRLIRTRKSKVLALIGAFETVISIQKKSSARTTSKAKRRISSSKISR